MKRPKKLVIIPAYNEEKNIRKVIKNIRDNNQGLDILVINDCSADRTAELAEQENAIVVSHALNAGYGAALQTGYKYALYKNYDMVIQIDGDGQHDPAYISKLAVEIEEGRADLVIGSRFLGNLRKYDMPLIRKAGLRFFQFVIYLLTKRKISDPTSGYQALSKKVIEFYANAEVFPPDFPDADVIVQLLYTGFRISELPVVMHENRGRQSMHSGLKPGYYVVKMLLSLYIIQRNKPKGLKANVVQS